MRWRSYGGAMLVVAACTALAALMQTRFDLSNLTMVYLVGVVVSAMAFGRGPAMLAALLSVAVFDFSFVQPRFTFRVSDTQYLVTFAVMLLVAAVIGTLTASLREQLESSRQRERRTAALYRLSHDLAAHDTAPGAMRAAVERIAEILEARVAVLLPDTQGRLAVAAGDPGLVTPSGGVGLPIHGMPGAEGRRDVRTPDDLYLPLRISTKTHGLLCVRLDAPQGPHAGERLELVRALASQTSLALERCALAEDAQRARVEVEAERTRSALLSSISHDLRTPLAAITGAASGLAGDAGTMSEAVRRELTETISDEAHRLNRLIGNLLDMTRLESGALRVRKDWHSLEEVVGAALARLETRLGCRPIRLSLPETLPLVPLDDVLFEQVISNLVENADKYAPAGTPIEIAAAVEGSEARMDVADRGPGLRPGEEMRVFEKFYRGPAAAAAPGVGLGLTICHGIVAAHGGSLIAANRADGGAVFTVRLPLEGEPPVVEREAADDARPERSP